MAESNDSGSKRVRSPGYPTLSLNVAIEKALDFYNAEGRNSAALDRKSTRLNSSHIPLSRMPSSA